MVLAWAVGWVTGRVSGGASEAQSPLPLLGRAPTYHGLVNQLGRRVSSTQFRGKVRVVTFLFPYCTTYCPLIAAHLVGFERVLSESGLRDQVQVIAFNVDPAGTGPEVMAAFMQEYGWNPSDLHWQYLTGSPAAIRRVVTGGYHVAYAKVAEGSDATAGGPPLTPQPEVVNRLAQQAGAAYDITHNDGLVIVDRRGRIRRIYDQADTVSVRRMLGVVRPLLESSPS